MRLGKVVLKKWYLKWVLREVLLGNMGLKKGMFRGIDFMWLKNEVKRER